MLVYRDNERVRDTASSLARVLAVAEVASRNPTRDATVDLLIELGEFEAAGFARLTLRACRAIDVQNTIEGS